MRQADAFGYGQKAKACERTACPSRVLSDTPRPDHRPAWSGRSRGLWPGSTQAGSLTAKPDPMPLVKRAVERQFRIARQLRHAPKR